jgi:hypothetical protein
MWYDSNIWEWQQIKITFMRILRVYLLFYRLLFKSVGIKIHRTIILPVVLYGCKTLNENEGVCEQGDENIWT